MLVYIEIDFGTRTPFDEIEVVENVLARNNLLILLKLNIVSLALTRLTLNQMSNDCSETGLTFGRFFFFFLFFRSSLKLSASDPCMNSINVLP